MYTISSELYLEVADSLMAQIGTKEFFSGRVDVVDGDTLCSLVCTLLVHHGKAEEGRSYPPITRLIPVWWEFRTIRGTEEILNDFSFTEMLTLAM